MASLSSRKLPPVGAFGVAADAFLLDVDGTIIDIAPTPDAVDVPESLKQTLVKLQKETAGALALVSGRKLAALDSLFAPLTLAAVGCHGAEWRLQPEHPVAVRSQPLSPEARQAFLAAVDRTSKIRVEDKKYTIAFHYRSAPELAPALEAALNRVLTPHMSELRLLHGKLVMEVKSRGFDKGEVIRALMQYPPFAGRRPVFLGDDTTDEDAFAAVHELGGVGISVGRPMANAKYMLPNPQSARDWLSVIVSGTSKI
jgi:trehalose 6-phosphate phosphatase